MQAASLREYHEKRSIVRKPPRHTGHSCRRILVVQHFRCNGTSHWIPDCGLSARHTKNGHCAYGLCGSISDEVNVRITVAPAHKIELCLAAHLLEIRRYPQLLQYRIS